MSAMASQITNLTIVYSSVYSGADQRQHQRSVSLAFVREIHRGPVNSPHKWPVTRKMFLFDDVIMISGHWWEIFSVCGTAIFLHILWNVKCFCLVVNGNCLVLFNCADFGIRINPCTVVPSLHIGRRRHEWWSHTSCRNSPSTMAWMVSGVKCSPSHLTHLSLMPSVNCDRIGSGNRWQAITTTSADLLILRDKFQWKLNRNSNIFIQENAFENVVCEMAAILSRGEMSSNLAVVFIFLCPCF